MNTKPFLWAILFLAFALAACSPPERSQWPRAHILIDPQARRLITECDLREFAREDGSILDFDVQSPEQIRALIGKGTDADVVILSDAALWRDLERNQRLASDPWRFESYRQTVLIVAPAAGSSTASLELAVDSPATAGGRMAQRALKEAGIWKIDPRSKRDDPANILLVTGEPAALDAVRAGRARAAAVLSDFEARMGRPWRVQRRLDPYPEWPAFCAAGVLAGSSQPEMARRAWCFLERILKPIELGYTVKKS